MRSSCVSSTCACENLPCQVACVLWCRISQSSTLISFAAVCVARTATTRIYAYTPQFQLISLLSPLQKGHIPCHLPQRLFLTSQGAAGPHAAGLESGGHGPGLTLLLVGNDRDRYPPASAQTRRAVAHAGPGLGSRHATQHLYAVCGLETWCGGLPGGQTRRARRCRRL